MEFLIVGVMILLFLMMVICLLCCLVCLGELWGKRRDADESIQPEANAGRGLDPGLLSELANLMAYDGRRQGKYENK